MSTLALWSLETVPCNYFLLYVIGMLPDCPRELLQIFATIALRKTFTVKILWIM